MPGKQQAGGSGPRPKKKKGGTAKGAAASPSVALALVGAKDMNGSPAKLKAYQDEQAARLATEAKKKRKKKG